jgi:beta-glucuronidase
MKKKEAENFQEGIHMRDYEMPYYSKRVGAESMINDFGRQRDSLNGEWSLGIDQYDHCLRTRWFDEVNTDDKGREIPIDYTFDAWEKIPVPSCWNMLRDRYFIYEGTCVYTRTFPFATHANDKASSKERVFLKFGAAANEAKVFLNKEYLGMHTGGYTPFYFEVGELLKEQNRLVVVVNNTRKRTGIPCENTDWFNYGGLYREVALLRVPLTFIRDFFISLVPDGTFKKIRAVIKTDGVDSKGTATIEIPELGVNTGIAVNNGSGEVVFEAAPELWSPESPRLYDVIVSCGEDKLTERVGFREITVKGDCIYLNGQEVYLKGVCTHEESVPNGRAVSEDEVRENYAIAKEMGCNYMRLAHYPHHEAAARIADEVGIMLWEEIPVYWAIEFGNPDTYKNAENQLEELILRDRNRASVIIWSVGNENADTDDRLAFMSALTEKARYLDPTRAVSAACLVDFTKLLINDRLADYLDIIGVNEYYGWYDPDFSKLPKIFENSQCEKPVIISEFGADAKVGALGSPNELYTELGQKNVYEKQVEVLGKISYVKGLSPWILYDFRCPRRLHVMQNYYNIKGLLSADKKYKKPAFEVMRAFYSLINSPALFVGDSG